MFIARASSGGGSSVGPSLEAAIAQLSQPAPEARGNPWALALGSAAQSRPGLAVAASVTAAAAAIGVLLLLHGASEGNQGALGAVVLGAAASLGLGAWALAHAPFDLVRQMSGSLAAVKHSGLSLAHTAQHLDRTAEASQAAVADLTVQLAAAASLEQQLRVTANGLKDTLGQMLQQQAGMAAFAERFEADLAEVLDDADGGRAAVSNQLYSTFVGLDAQLARSEALSQQLDGIVEANRALAVELGRASTALHDSLALLEDEAFDQVIEQVMRDLDELGDSGLRQRLGQSGDVVIPALQAPALLMLLEHVDGTLRRQADQRRGDRAQLRARSVPLRSAASRAKSLAAAHAGGSASPAGRRSVRV